MLGGRKRLKNLDIFCLELQRRIQQLEDETLRLTSRLAHLNKEFDAAEEDRKTNISTEPVDKYAKMRTRDGLLSYQTYKARKSGIGGE